jgi:hypothetical protein
MTTGRAFRYNDTGGSEPVAPTETAYSDTGITDIRTRGPWTPPDNPDPDGTWSSPTAMGGARGVPAPPPKPTYRFTGTELPPALARFADKRVFLVWKYVLNRNNKWDKPPCSWRTGYVADFTDPNNLCTFQEALAAMKRFNLDGIGIALEAAGLSGVDLDDCINDAGSYSELAAAVLEYRETYAEFSPSGSGIHFLIDKNLGLTIKRDADLGIEVYSHGRYFTVTGKQVDESPNSIGAAPKLIEHLVRIDAETPKPSKEGASNSARAQAQVRRPGDDYWSNVNSTALANLDRWVPALHPTAKKQAKGAWRVKSKDLGRNLQEDLSYHPKGVSDWGEEHKLTPIDAVQQFGTAANAAEAAQWLCRQMGVEPAALGWIGQWKKEVGRTKPNPSATGEEISPDLEQNFNGAFQEAFDSLQQENRAPPNSPSDEERVSINPGLADLQGGAFDKLLKREGASPPPPPGGGGDRPIGEKSGRDRTPQDYFWVESQGAYLNLRAREYVSAATVDARSSAVMIGRDKETKEAIYEAASKWIRTHRPLEQVTWNPGKPLVMEDTRVTPGGFMRSKGVNILNTYEPPIRVLGDPSDVQPYLDHVAKLVPDPKNVEHLLNCFAHRVQRPWEKINHHIVIGGETEGGGKDTVLKPLRYAIGSWNFGECKPAQLFEKFNAPYLKNVVLRVSEAADMGGGDGKMYSRVEFREHLKILGATPPEMLDVQDKHIRAHKIANVVFLIITTNNWNALMIQVGDRRYFVIFTRVRLEDFGATKEEQEAYFNRLHKWLDEQGGNQNVAAFLATRDLSKFSPTAPPPKTADFYEMANAHKTDQDAELDQIIEELGTPEGGVPAVLTAEAIAARADPKLAEWIRDTSNATSLSNRMTSNGYVKFGRPKLGGKVRSVYVLRTMAPELQKCFVNILQEDAAMAKKLGEPWLFPGYILRNRIPE